MHVKLFEGLKVGALLLSFLTLKPTLADEPTCQASADPPVPPSPDARFRIGELFFEDDFESGLTQWHAELENGGRVEAKAGQLEIEVPAGATVWFKPCIEGPVLIEYEAEVVGEGGPNDRVSDLNCFWMARDARSEKDLFATQRSGKFADYNPLKTYYVGLGGNSNTTTRFRRYIGDVDVRPLLPEHDLRDAKFLIQPNRAQTIQLVADGALIQFYRDGKRLFEFNDSAPYTSGWFSFRTVTSHLIFRHFRVFRLFPPLAK